MPPPVPPKSPGKAVDLSIRGSGKISVDHPDATIEATVEASGPVGVRLGGLRVAPKSAHAIDLHARTHDLAQRLRPGGERLRAVEVDRTLGGGQLRTDPRDLRGGRYFQVDVRATGEAELHRVRVDSNTGERSRESFDLTRRQLEALVDDLATLPPEELVEMGGMLTILGLLVSMASTADAADPPPFWLDLGRPDDGRSPIAVIIPQPGLRPFAYSALVEHLEAGGLNAGLVALPASPHALTHSVLPQLLDGLDHRNVLVVGHGYGGRSALSTAGLDTSTCGVALLGVPLVTRNTPWQATLASHPPPLGGVLLRHAQRSGHPQAPWPLVRTEPGFPTAWLGRLSADWYLAMAQTGTAVSVPHTPLWVATAPLDELAPPETLGTLPESTTVTRWGMLRGWRTDADSTTLLTDPRPAAHLARWGLRVCA